MSEESVGCPVSLRRALGKGFREVYDRLGYVVVSTLAWFVAIALVSGLAALVVRSMPGMAAGLKVLMIAPAVLVGYLGAVGVFYFANRAVFGHNPSAVDTFAGIRALLGPAVKLFVVDGVVTAVLAVDMAFFVSLVTRGPVFLGLAVLCGYMLLMWLAVSMYHLPLLIAQTEMESGPRPAVILRKSALLTIDNPGFTAGLFLAIIAIAALSVIPACIGFVVFFLGAIAFVLTHALRELFTKYGIIEPDPEPIADEQWSVPGPRRPKDSAGDSDIEAQ